MSEDFENDLSKKLANDSVKELADALKKINGSYEEFDIEGENEVPSDEQSSQFRVAGANLPEKPSTWTKIKNALFYEIKVELTPYQQKIENEINDFLHQDITWKSLKEAALSEVAITYRGKRIF